MAATQEASTSSFPRVESYATTIVPEGVPLSESPTIVVAPSTLPSKPQRPTADFFDKGKDAAKARALYLRILAIGILQIVLIIFVVLPLYWGALWKAPKPIEGWIVDFDGSQIGQAVVQAIESAPRTTIDWKVVPSSQFPGGPSQLGRALIDEQAWVAVSINANATQRLAGAVQSGDSSYNGSAVITAYGVEARQETLYRSIVRPTILSLLPTVSEHFAKEFARNMSHQTNYSSIIAAAPQLAVEPISYTLVNLIPFDIPVASAVTFVGLIYLLILTFFLLNMAMAARQVSGLERKLSLGGLIRLRLGSAFIAYLVISLFYTLLSRAFQLPLNRHFGSAGFVLLWMVNWAGMLALGLALESVITLITIRFMPFFLIPWVVTNVSVAVLPIQVQHVVYRYGYAMPFYNVSRAVRTIVFGTKNELGMNFGILIAWAILSCITLSLFQWYVRRRDERAAVAAALEKETQVDGTIEKV